MLTLFFFLGGLVLFQLYAGYTRQAAVREEVIEDPIFRPTDTSKIVEDPLTKMLFEGGVVMVVVHEGVTRDQVAEAVEIVNGEVAGGLAEIRVFEIAIPEDDPAALHAAISSLKHSHIFEAVLPNYVPGIDESTKTPDVPQWERFYNQKKCWGQREIKMPQAWPISTGESKNRLDLISKSNHRIAIIDTGFDLSHPDLGNSILIAISPVSWYDLKKINHGTSVASVVGANAYNKQGMAGIMWQPELHCYQVASFKDINAALYHAYQKGIRVANISMGINWKLMQELSGNEFDSIIVDIRAVLKGCIEHIGKDNALTNPGMVVVSSAGNAPKHSADINYPSGFAADYDHVISVGSIARDGSASNFSSSGSSVSIAAPGEDIWMARKVFPIISNYHYSQGASFASPMVAGVAGLILTVNPDLSPGEIKQIIMDTATPKNFDRPLGNGVVDAAAALRAAQATLDGQGLMAPNLIYPADGSNVVETSITFRWEEVPGADSYLLEIMQVDENVPVVEEKLGSTTDYTVKNFPGDGSNYRWRVKAGTLAGWGPYSNIHIFKSGIAPVPTPPEPEEIEHADPKGKGNTAGNIENLGLAVIHGDWIYYVNDNDGYSIYKIRTNGSGRTKVNDDNSRYLNVVDDWIYYSNNEGQGLAAAEIIDPSRNYHIYKIRTDGTGRTKLNSDLSLTLQVVDGWIYYSNYSDSRKLYKIRTDGSDRTKLNDDITLFINVEEDWIYYSNENDNQKVYKVGIDGKSRTRINEHVPTCHYLNIIDDWIYLSVVSHGGKISRMRTDGSDGGEVGSDLNAHYLNAAGNHIYYIHSGSDGALYRINKDGGSKTQISSDNAWLINIVGEWIYYSNRDDNNRFYRIRTDGSGREKLQ